LKEAFERLDGRPAEWIVFDDERAAAYLHAAVYNQAQRVRRDRERPDRVWWTKTDPETKKKIELPRPVQPERDVEFMVRGSGNPADIVANYMDDRAKALLLLYEQGSDEDKEFIRLFFEGHSQADIADDYGWAKVQRFTRKAERWRIKHNPPIDG
jgi:DNA-directed RNA polymerase specialized sigma24 family protein